MREPTLDTHLSHVIVVHKRSGRFGEDIDAVRCRFCRQVWTNEPQFSRERTGEQPCKARPRKDRAAQGGTDRG